MNYSKLEGVKNLLQQRIAKLCRSYNYRYCLDEIQWSDYLECEVRKNHHFTKAELNSVLNRIAREQRTLLQVKSQLIFLKKLYIIILCLKKNIQY